MKRLPVHIFLSIILAVATGGCRSADGGSQEEHEHEHEHGGDIELTQAQMDAVGIQIGSIQQRDMEDGVSTTGLLSADPGHESAVASRLPGTVSSIRVKEGDRVRAGEVIAYVNAPELMGLRQNYQLAAADVARAKAEVERQEALSSQGAGVRKNLDNARSELSSAEIRQRSALAMLKEYGAAADGNNASVAVKAEISGTVVSVDLPIGGFTDMQTPIARIVNTDGVFCTLQILEKDVNRVKAGMKVDMRLTNDPSVTFSGNVVEVNPVLDAQSNTVAVRVSVKDKPSAAMLIPGMAVSAAISLDGTTMSVLPEGAIVSSGGKSYIFVLEKTDMENGEKTYHFEKREVVTGASSLGFTAVTPVEKLEEDAQIVVAGAFYLNSMSTEHGEHSH